MRDRAVTALPTIAVEARMAGVMEAVHLTNTTENGTFPDIPGVVRESVGVYTDALGPVALIIFFLIPFGMMFIANRSMKGIAIIGIVVSTFVLVYLPSNFQAAGLVCIAISGVAIAYSLFKQPGG